LAAGQYTNALDTFRNFSEMGLIATHASDALVSDLGAAATSLATASTSAQGSRGALGNQRSWLELADASGMDTAIVTTADLGNQGIAALISRADAATSPHVQVSTFGESAGSDGLDVVFAGGRAGYSDAELAAWQARGVELSETWSPLSSSSQQVVRLLADAALAPASERLRGNGPTLGEMTSAAIEQLQGRNSGNGFFLTIYADGLRQQVDQQNRDAELLDELTELDGALQAALSGAARAGDTAVVLVSLRDSTLSVIDNHYGFHKKHCGIAMRCGGPEMLFDLPVAVGEIRNTEGFSNVALQGDFSPIAVILQYAWPFQAAGPADAPSSASATFTPLFASGPGAESLEGFATLSEVGEVVASWLTR
jgi:alkaline phosphatase